MVEKRIINNLYAFVLGLVVIVFLSSVPDIMRNVVFFLPPIIFILIILGIVFICLGAEDFKRIKYVSKHKTYMKYKNNVYELFNKQVYIRYNSKRRYLRCNNLRKTDEFCTLNIPSIDYTNSNNLYYRIIDTVFNGILYSFSEQTNYDSLVYALKLNFGNNIRSSTEVLHKPVQTKKELPPLPKIYINSSDEKELAKLPGINIITAKKLLRYRQENCGFKSKEEFIKLAKLKDVFKDRVEKAIVLDHIENKPNTEKGQERSVDF